MLTPTIAYGRRKMHYFDHEVRHEVAIQTVAAGGHLKATYCSVSSSLPGHAIGAI